MTMANAPAGAQAPAGEIKGTALVHDAASARGVISGANVALPSAVTGGAPFFGKYRDAPALQPRRVPVVIFLHGSSGLGLKAIEEWQRWLADQGMASLAPDSFALPDRLTYSSPIDRPTYERIHALRASEIGLALEAMKEAPWADPQRIVLAGTSEGAVAVAREGDRRIRARMIFSWSCEDNYFVEGHRTATPEGQPVLNVISSVDPFFSPSNAWLGAPAARGHCAAAFASSKEATIALVPGAPHTLINLPQARRAVGAFLADVLRP
jgi:dienelactone hydrolase